MATLKIRLQTQEPWGDRLKPHPNHSKFIQGFSPHFGIYFLRFSVTTFEKVAQLGEDVHGDGVGELKHVSLKSKPSSTLISD